MPHADVQSQTERHKEKTKKTWIGFGFRCLLETYLRNLGTKDINYASIESTCVTAAPMLNYAYMNKKIGKISYMGKGGPQVRIEWLSLGQNRGSMTIFKTSCAACMINTKLPKNDNMTNGLTTRKIK